MNRDKEMLLSRILVGQNIGYSKAIIGAEEASNERLSEWYRMMNEMKKPVENSTAVKKVLRCRHLRISDE